MECILYQIWDELGPVPEPKLPRGYGYLLTYLRNQTGLSQTAFAEWIKLPGESTGAVLSSLKKMETNRKLVPVVLLERGGKKLGWKDRWWLDVPVSVATSQLRVLEPVAAYRSHAESFPGVRLPMSPTDRSAQLRSLFVADRTVFNRFKSFPSWFTIPGFKPYLKDDVGPDYPILLGDEVFEGDPDIDDSKIMVGDDFAVRTDEIPIPGDLVAATGRKGERYRRLLLKVDGDIVLRHFTLKAPDISIYKIAAIEGILCGRSRRFADVDGGQAVFVARGLSVRHL